MSTAITETCVQTSIHAPLPVHRDPAAVFAALGDPTRLTLINRLSEGGGRSIASLSEGIPLTRQAVSKHLQVLETAGLVTSRRVGRESRYAVKPETFEVARSYLEEVTAHCAGVLSELRARANR